MNAETWDAARDRITEVNEAICGERERIRCGAEALKFTLARPGLGYGSAHGQVVEVVPWADLAGLLGGDSPDDPALD